MDKRHNFVLRTISCISISILFATLFAYLESQVISTLASYLSLAFDALMYLCVIGSIFFLVSHTSSTKFFIATVIFLGKNFVFVFEQLVIALLSLLNIKLVYYFQWTLEVGIFALACLFIYFLFVKNFKGKIEPISYKYTVIFMGLFVSISLLFEASTIMITYKSSQFTLLLAIAELLYFVVMTSFFFFMMKQEENTAMLSVVKQMWNEDRKQYQIQKESMDIINIKCHDLRHQIQNYRDSNEAGNSKGGVDSMMKQLENSIYIYDAVIKTGNEVLDVILSNISLRCQKKEVQLTCMVDGKLMKFMEEADTYSLFGNMLDNALEYEEKVSDQHNRFISLTVKQIQGFAHVHCENYYEGNPTLVKGKIVTTKGDNVNHGFGIKSMEQIVSKYEGRFDILIADDMFQIDIMIPLKESKTNEQA
jgi:hypothetical protein